MPPADADGPSSAEPTPPVGPVWRRTYEPNPKHGPVDRGSVSREPANGQNALDHSVRVKATSELRIGIDYEDAAFVVLRYHHAAHVPSRPWAERYHGYVVPWKLLTQDQRNALVRAGMADHRGRIL